MSALIHHLRFLRPLRSALLAAFYTSAAVGVSKRFLGLDPGVAQMSAYLVALPLLVGVLLAGAAHEPLHRPFARLLPGIRRRQLRFATLTTALAALAITAISLWTTPNVSPVASLGLVAALLALPHLDSHRLRGVLSGPCNEFIVWLLLSYAFALGLILTPNAGPWLCLLCGLAFAAFAFRQGYSRSGLRLRSHLPFVAYQTRFFVHVFNPAIAERWRTEGASRLKNHTSLFAPAEPLAVSPPITASLRPWLRVLRHLAFGAWQHASRISFQTAMLVTVLGCFALYPAVGLHAGQPDYWTALAHAINSKFTTQFQFTVAVGIVLLASPPTVIFPISRAFLGRISFWHAVAIWLSAVLFSFAIISLPSLIGQLVSGQALPSYGLSNLLSRSLLLAAMLPLVIAANQQRARRHLVVAGSIFIVTLASYPAHKLLVDYALEPVGFTLLLAAIVGTLALLHYRLRRHYASCDLP